MAGFTGRLIAAPVIACGGILQHSADGKDGVIGAIVEIVGGLGTTMGTTLQSRLDI